MKIAYYHLIGKRVKVTIATYDSDTPELREDMITKYKLDHFMERYGMVFECKTLEELFEGKFGIKGLIIIFEILLNLKVGALTLNMEIHGETSTCYLNI